MLNIFGKPSKIIQLALKEFEVMVKISQRGEFITQENVVCRGSVYARTIEEANILAAELGGFAVLKMNG